jgi:ABC-type Fe2+-enterobactin transport system substrate-binding protein
MTSHLIALQNRLADEQGFLAIEKTAAGRDLRTVWIAQIEREIAAEKAFLGMEDVACDMSDEDILAALAA